MSQDDRGLNLTRSVRSVTVSNGGEGGLGLMIKAPKSTVFATLYGDSSVFPDSRLFM
jgi:hypothetical protein